MMSGTSDHHHHRSGDIRAGGGGVGSSGAGAGAVIRPRPVTEKSLLESVAGFITEVHGTALQSSQQGSTFPNNSQGDPKIHVTWARFEVSDPNSLDLLQGGQDWNSVTAPPLLLILGYTQGVQVWLIPSSGEAKEVLSWKQGYVKTLRLLPSPEKCFRLPDNFAHCRPLIALADSSGPGLAFSSAGFISLKSGEQVHSIKFNSEIADILSNRRAVVISFREKFAVFDACNLEARFTITSCYPSPGVHANPIALGTRWLAYADRNLVHQHRSLGGMESEGGQSMAAWGINVGSKLAEGVSKIYSNFFSTSASKESLHSGGSASSPSGGRTRTYSTTSEAGASVVAGGGHKGVVTVLDFMRVNKGEEVNIEENPEGVLAHFIAHNRAIVAMQFDQSGQLLLTADRTGNYFNLFRVVPHVAGSCYAAVHHLYALYRGDTPGSVQDIAFSSDARWVAVSTLRGTTHIFPITPYGGPVGVRTHTSARVVNKLSRFHRSAGIDDYHPIAGSSGSTGGSGRTSPNPNNFAPGTSPSLNTSGFSKMAGYHSSLGSGDASSQMNIVPYPNPLIPPFPGPTLVQPLAQLRQPYIDTINKTIGTVAAASVAASKKKSSSGSSTAEEVPIRLACAFASSRAWLIGAQHNMFNRHHQRPKAHDALYVVANHGVLLEYSMDVIPDSTLPKERICESSPIELIVSPYGQWSLTQPRDRAELQPPLPIDSPLMIPVIGRRRSAINQEEDTNKEDKWLSQVEIVTHLGPHRRLWMGPQFSFKTLEPVDGGRGVVIRDLDISLPTRPEPSNPVNIASKTIGPANVPHHSISFESGSASSFEMSSHFSDAYSGRKPVSRSSSNLGTTTSASTGGGGGVNLLGDVESELQEAMSDMVLGSGEGNLLEGLSSSNSNVSKQQHQAPPVQHQQQQRHHSSEEEFFCLSTPEQETRSSGSNRSRNPSSGVVASAASTTASIPPPSVSIESAKISSVTVFDSSTKKASKSITQKAKSKTSPGVAVKQKSETSQPSSSAVGKTKETKVKAKETSESEEYGSEFAKTTSSTSSKKKSKKEKKAQEQKAAKADNSSDREFREISPIKAIKTSESSNEDIAIIDINEPDKAEAKNATVVVVTTQPLAGSSSLLTSKAVVATAPLKEEKKKKDLVADLLMEAASEDDEFHEIKPSKIDADDDEEEEEEKFEIKESEDEEEEDSGFKFDPESTGKPASKTQKESEILKGIQTADEKYNRKSNSASPARKTSTSKSAKKVEVDSSEDDGDFKPVERKTKKKAKNNQHQKLRSSASSGLADSEESSSCFDEEETTTSRSKTSKSTEGWSFEADDIDVNKLIDEVVGGGEAKVEEIEEEDEKEEKEEEKDPEEEEEDEKTALEDVFKFDSEIAAQERTRSSDDDDEEFKPVLKPVSWADMAKKKATSTVSLEVSKAEPTTTEDDESEPEGKDGGDLRKKLLMSSTSLNVSFDESDKISSDKARENAAKLTTSVSEGEGSSLGNSPMAKKNKGKNKKKKKKGF